MAKTTRVHGIDLTVFGSPTGSDHAGGDQWRLQLGPVSAYITLERDHALELADAIRTCTHEGPPRPSECVMDGCDRPRTHGAFCDECVHDPDGRQALAAKEKGRSWCKKLGGIVDDCVLSGGNRCTGSLCPRRGRSTFGREHDEPPGADAVLHDLDKLTKRAINAAECEGANKWLALDALGGLALFLRASYGLDPHTPPDEPIGEEVGGSQPGVPERLVMAIALEAARLVDEGYLTPAPGAIGGTVFARFRDVLALELPRVDATLLSRIAGQIVDALGLPAVGALETVDTVLDSVIEQLKRVRQRRLGGELEEPRGFQAKVFQVLALNAATAQSGFGRNFRTKEGYAQEIDRLVEALMAELGWKSGGDAVLEQIRSQIRRVLVRELPFSESGSESRNP